MARVVYLILFASLLVAPVSTVQADDEGAEATGRLRVRPRRLKTQRRKK